MTNTIQVRRGSSGSLPTLNVGEFGFTTDSYQTFIGDGVTNHELLSHDKFDANTILSANSDNTPVALSVGEQTILGRAGGNIAALSAGDVRTLISVDENASSAVSLWFGAESAYLPATNPAALSEVAGSGVYAGWSYLAFDDTTSEHAVWRAPVPDYDGGNIVVTAFSKPAATPAGNVSLQYNILTIGLGNSEIFNTADTVDTNVNISHSLSTATLNTDVCVVSAVIDPANVVADDLMIMELSRDVASDDLTGDGQLLGILIEYKRS